MTMMPFLDEVAVFFLGGDIFCTPVRQTCLPWVITFFIFYRDQHMCSGHAFHKVFTTPLWDVRFVLMVLALSISPPSISSRPIYVSTCIYRSRYTPIVKRPWIATAVVRFKMLCSISQRHIMGSIDGGTYCFALCSANGVVSPISVVLHDSGFFKKIVSKTKSGLGKVRQSLSPRKDKAVGDSEVEVGQV